MVKNHSRNGGVHGSAAARLLHSEVGSVSTLLRFGFPNQFNFGFSLNLTLVLVSHLVPTRFYFGSLLYVVSFFCFPHCLWQGCVVVVVDTMNMLFHLEFILLTRGSHLRDKFDTKLFSLSHVWKVISNHLLNHFKSQEYDAFMGCDLYDCSDSVLLMVMSWCEDLFLDIWLFFCYFCFEFYDRYCSEVW